LGLDDRAEARHVAETANRVAYAEATELGEMARDILFDRQGFTDRRTAFVLKKQAPQTPPAIAEHRR
jgi:hypothetical protein